MKMLAYIRVSTDKQADHGVSLEAQKANIRSYAALYGMSITQTIKDAGESAGTLERPGLKTVLAMLKSGQAEGVIVTKLDRLTRSVKDLGYLIENYFTKYRLASVTDQIDTASASGRLILNVLTSVSQWEREVTSERTKVALKQLKDNGKRYSGEAPYGMAVLGKQLIEDQRERNNILTIKNYRLAGYTLKGIKKRLSQDGIVNRNGKPFTLSALHRICKGN